MASGSKRVIYAAMVGNGLIAIAKFVGAALTGSSAMLSEGIHSLVDTGNQSLLLYGICAFQTTGRRKTPVWLCFRNLFLGVYRGDPDFLRWRGHIDLPRDRESLASSSGARPVHQLRHLDTGDDF